MPSSPAGRVRAIHASAAAAPCARGMAPWRAAGVLLLAMLAALPGTACSRNPMTPSPFDNPDIAPLADAVARDDGAEARRQLQRIAADTPGSDGTSLLQWAVMGGKLEAARALLDAGADPNRISPGGGTPMHAAAFASDPDGLRLLLAHGGDPRVRNGATGETPLVRAIVGRRVAQARMLLDAGADPAAADPNGGTPLHAAAQVNASDLVLLLLEAGAPPLAKDSAGHTFQPVFFQRPAARLNDKGRADRAAVVAWLKANGVPLEAGVAP